MMQGIRWMLGTEKLYLRVMKLLLEKFEVTFSAHIFLFLKTAKYAI